MDLAFAPGTTGQDGRLRRMLSARTNTQLISKAGIASIADFFKELVAQSLTADDLIGGSHASDEGFLFLPLDSTTTQMPIDFETLDAVNTSGTIKIPASIKGANTSFHFKGCAIGSDDSLPFLTLLKQALDNPQSVTAPKFFHGLYEFIGQGIFEFMLYGYRVMNKTAFATRADLIAAYTAGGFTEELDGTAVPAANWSKWVKSTLQLAPATQHKVQFNFPVTINPAAGSVSAIPDLSAECRSRAEHFTYTLSGGPFPTDNPGRIASLKSGMSADPTFLSAHPYPKYQRMHFPDFDSFFDGLSWKVTVKGSDMNAVGTHFVYTLVIPILQPGTTDQLLFNYYPASGTPVMNFKEDNAAFNMFGVV